MAKQKRRKAVELDPNLSLWHQNLGFILDEMGGDEKSVNALLKSIAKDKDWGTEYKTGSLIEIAYHYYCNHNYSESISTLNEALDTANKEAGSPETIKFIYLYLSYNYTAETPASNPCYDLNKAQELKSKAYALNPADLFVQASITKLLILQNELSLANNRIQEIEKALIKPNVPNRSIVYSYLGHIYSLLNDPQKSADAMMQAMDLHSGEARYLLSELNNDFKNVSNSEEMKAVIERAKTIMQKNKCSDQFMELNEDQR